MNSAQSQRVRHFGSSFLVTVFEPDGPQDQRRKDQEHRKIEPRKADRIKRWPGGEDRSAAKDQPDLVAFPDRADGVDGNAPLDIGAGRKGQQRANPHVKAIGHRKADQKEPHQPPPDQAQCLIADKFMQDHARVTPLA